MKETNMDGSEPEKASAWKSLTILLANKFQAQGMGQFKRTASSLHTHYVDMKNFVRTTCLMY